MRSRPARSRAPHAGVVRTRGRLSTGDQKAGCLPLYGQGMDTLLLLRASHDLARATALTPLTPPSSWHGPAASACQGRLTELRSLLSALNTHLEEATTRTRLVQDTSMICLVP